MKQLTHTALRAFLILCLTTGLFYCTKKNNDRIIAPGMVDGDMITLKAQVAGTIQQMNLKEGEPVTRLAPLVTLNTDKVENQLRELEIQLKEIAIKEQKIAQNLRLVQGNSQYLNKQAQRFRRLKEQNAIPGEKLEALEVKLLETETSRLDLQRTRDELGIQKEKIENKREYLKLLIADHSIVSPVDGVVVETFVSQGENVFPGTSIADIIDRASLYVEIFIEEPEMAALTLNQAVEIQTDGPDNTGTVLNGQISYFGKKAEFSPKYIISEHERKSLLYQVKIRVSDPQGTLKIGMPVTVVLKKHA